MHDDEPTAPARDSNGRWVAGAKSETCSNRHGRPLGARTKLSDTFLKDLLANWENHGAATIEDFRQAKPNEYVRMVASLLPRNFNIKVNELDELTDEQLEQQHAALCAAIEAAEAAERAAAEYAAEQATPHLLPSLCEAG